MATHAETGSRSSDITYVIRDGARHGRLENLETGKQIKRKFSQKDVNDGKIVYVINDHSSSTNDSFVFRVQDQRQNTLDDQRFVSDKKYHLSFPVAAISTARCLVVLLIRRAQLIKLFFFLLLHF